MVYIYDGLHNYCQNCRNVVCLHINLLHPNRNLLSQRCYDTTRSCMFAPTLVFDVSDDSPDAVAAVASITNVARQRRNPFNTSFHPREN